MLKNTPINFFKQVKQEALKVTWSSRKETMTSTLIVLFMLFLTSIFFFIIDSILVKLIEIIFGF